MAIRYTDAQIAELLAERKLMPSGFRAGMRWHQKGCHRECRIAVTGDADHEFQLLLRQNSLNQDDFTVILIYCPSESSFVFRLRRHNGRNQEHTNSIERDRFYAHHVHMATERYQEAGAKEDAYATPTTRYTDIEGALDCMLADAGFVLVDEPSPQLRLLGGDET